MAWTVAINNAPSQLSKNIHAAILIGIHRTSLISVSFYVYKTNWLSQEYIRCLVCHAQKLPNLCSLVDAASLQAASTTTGFSVLCC